MKFLRGSFLQEKTKTRYVKFTMILDVLWLPAAAARSQRQAPPVRSGRPWPEPAWPGAARHVIVGCPGSLRAVPSLSLTASGTQAGSSAAAATSAAAAAATGPVPWPVRAEKLIENDVLSLSAK